MDSLHRYRPICDAIAALFQPYVEVVLHELATDKAVYIAGNFSKRVLGEPSLLHEVDFDSQNPVIGPYEKVNWDGRALKSITVVLRDEAGAPLGVMCINVNVSDFHAVMQTLSAGLQFSYSVNEARHINRKFSQIIITASVQLSLFAGDYR